jgi:signal transduction histidine kinase
MRLRSSLILLTLATVLPVALFGVILSAVLVERDRTTFRRGAEARTLATTGAVDVAVRGAMATVQSLAYSPSLDDGDLEYFRDSAARLLASQPDWANIDLALPSGQRMVDLLLSPGQAAPSLAGDEALTRLVATGRPQVGGITPGTLSGQWVIPVRVPVFRQGQLRYVLSAVLRPEAIANVLQTQRLPEDWEAKVIDGNKRIVASTPHADVIVGQPAEESLGTAPSGWMRHRTPQGVLVYTPYQRSELTGWVSAMVIPAEVVDGGEKRVAWLLAFAGLGAIGLAIGLALIIGRRIARPIAALAAATGAIGRGEPVQVPDQPAPDEVRSLARALRAAALAMREREQLIEREKEALHAADRAKDEFLAMLSHELRNPLAALTTAAHVLRMAPADAAATAKARSVIDRQAHHMSRMVEDLLDISRFAMGKVVLERRNFDLTEVVPNVVQMLRAAGWAAVERVSFDLSPVWINADSSRIEQIVANLLHNALKFTPDGKAIRMTVRQEGSQALLQVADEGEGLEPELLKQVFVPFVQGRRALERGAAGLGLGLPLVKNLAELHGGTVTAASDGPGRGAVFTVRLPAVPAGARKPEVLHPERRRSRRVLIIEDNDDAREMLHTALSLSGHQVSEARDGAAGIEIAAREQPDVALIDIGLPDIDGYEVARRLRAMTTRRRMTLVALTGYGQPADRERAFKAGFDVHLTKPVPPEQLKQALAALQ